MAQMTPVTLRANVKPVVDILGPMAARARRRLRLQRIRHSLIYTTAAATVFLLVVHIVEWV